MTHPSGSGKTSTTHTPADQALERGWDLYQLDGFWYVNNAAGARRQPTSHRQPPPVQELGAGVSPEEAMSRAKGEEQHRRPLPEATHLTTGTAWTDRPPVAPPPPTFTMPPKTPGSTR